jgi:hypothetical protein
MLRLLTMHTANTVMQGQEVAAPMAVVFLAFTQDQPGNEGRVHLEFLAEPERLRAFAAHLLNAADTADAFFQEVAGEARRIVELPPSNGVH